MMPVPSRVLQRRHAIDPTCTHTLTIRPTGPSSATETWSSCCNSTSASGDPAECPPVETHEGSYCPLNYNNCADPKTHEEMCSASQTGYGTHNSLNKKCCPAGYACGPTFDSPCELITDNASFTNPQYLTAEGVFAGCDDANQISAAAAGGVVACSIVGFVGICGIGLWFVRRGLYRAPKVKKRSEATEVELKTAPLSPVMEEDDHGSDGGTGGGAGGGADAGHKGMEGITVTSEIKIETPESSVVGDGDGDDPKSWLDTRMSRGEEELARERMEREKREGSVRMPKLLYRDRIG